MTDIVQKLWGFCHALGHSGWTKVGHDFGGKLIQFLREVNESIAA
jgi:hypothetical protein